MEFEKIFNFFTVSAVVILVVTTLICVSFVIIDKADSNLGATIGSISLENCTQILQEYC